MWRVVQVLIIACVLGGCARPGPEPQVHYQSVAALQVEAGQSYAVDRIFIGEVTAKQQTDIGFELAGTVTELLVAEGSAVQAGDPMAVLDTRLLLLEEQELNASLAETQARLGLAKSSLKRHRELKVSGFAADQRIDELESEEKGLVATSSRLEAALNANRTRQEKARLIAPFDGVVSQRYVDRGAVVATGAPVFQLLQSGAMELEIGVPIRLADQVLVGDSYPVVINDRRGEAELIALGANINTSTRTIPAWFSLSGISARDGELAAITLREIYQQPGYWIPVTAVTEGMRGTWVVYGLADEGDELYRVERHAVDVLYVAGQQFYVAGELDDIEIVGGGLHRVVPGQQVRVSERFIVTGEDG